MSGYGSIVKQPSGKYRVFWVVGGKRRSKVLGTSYKEAQKFLAHKQIETEGVQCCCTWLTYWHDVVEPSFEGLQPHTVLGYRKAWKVLEPIIGGRAVDAMNYRMADSVLQGVENPSTQKKCYVLLKKMCNMAVRDRLISANPVDRTIRLRKIEKREKLLYSRDDITLVLDAVRGIKYEVLLLLEVGAGLRHEEACAICGKDVTEVRTEDSVYAHISVNKALVVVGGTRYLKETKNGYSSRLVVMGEPFASRLLELKKDDGPMMRGMADGDGSEAAHYASPETVSHNWKIYCARHSLPYVRFGDMRSNYATLLGEAGALDSLVSLAMGHSGTTTKTRHYQRSTVKGLEIVADAYTEYLLDTD